METRPVARRQKQIGRTSHYLAALPTENLRGARIPQVDLALQVGAVNRQRRMDNHVFDKFARFPGTYLKRVALSDIGQTGQ